MGQGSGVIGGDEQVRLCQSVGEYLLQEFARTCAEVGVRFFLDCGALLGAFRHAGWITWDDDVDVVMLRADYERFRESAGDHLPADVALFDPVDTPGHATAIPRVAYLPSKVGYSERLGIAPPERQRIVLDIFVLDDAPAPGLPSKAWLAGTRALQVLKGLQCTRVRAVWADDAPPIVKAMATFLHGVAMTVPRRRLAQAYRALATRYAGKPGACDVVALNHSSDNRSQRFPRSWFEGDAESTVFEGLEFDSPPPALYLERLYGPSFREPPPPHQRHPHAFSHVEVAVPPPYRGQ